MKENKTNINWYPGHMAKTRKQIAQNLSLVDIVLEIVDARIPMSSKIKDIDSLIKDKPKIMVMTKSDLCDVNKTKLLIKKYEDIGYKVVLADLYNNIGLNNIIDSINELLEPLNNKRIDKGLKTKLYRALIVGIPNVGKSTLINRLASRKATDTGNKPGVTKRLSWIKVNNNLELLDSPGILWPKIDNEIQGYNLACFSAIKEEILPIGKVACYILDYMYNNYYENLFERYGDIKYDKDDVTIAYEIIGRKRGCVISGNQVDYDRVSKIIINDLNEGKLGKVTFDEV